MRKAFIFLYYLLVASLNCQAQNNKPIEVKHLVDIVERYRTVESLRFEITYKAYKDTLQKKLVDSSTQRSIFFNGNSFTSHLNTVAIVTSSKVFFIDHEKQLAYLDTQYSSKAPNLNSQIADFLNQSRGYSYRELGKGEYRYRVISDSVRFDWIEIDIDVENRVINKLAYKYSKENSLRSGVELMVMSFRKQLFNEKIDEKVFSLEDYVDFSKAKTVGLKSPYTNYKFISYLN